MSRTTLAASPVYRAIPQSPLPVEGAGGIVIGGDFHGLGIARSLGRRGIPVCVIDNEHSIARFSKYVTHYVRVPDLLDEQKTIESILDIGRHLNLKGWVLYATRDETVAAFSRYRDALSEWFRVPTPGWDAIEWAWDKRKTHALARELNIATPRTWFPRTVEDLAQISDHDFPVVIKPAIKEHFIYTTKVKAWRADNRDQLRDRFQQASALVPPGEVLIQDLIPGGSEQQFGYCAFFKEGRAIASTVTQYRRQHPPQFGRSCTLVETVDLPALEEIALRFLQRMDYYGLVELEFKLDPRSGEYSLLDVNARTWGYHTLGAAAGVDFASLLFADQTGKTVEPVRGQAGRTWVRLVTDVPTGLAKVLRRQLKFGAFLGSLKNADAESVFCIDDPIPSLVEAALVPYLIYKRGM